VNARLREPENEGKVRAWPLRNSNLNHGRCLAHTRRVLGYPCRATLSAWIDQHDDQARRHIVSKAVAAPVPEAHKRAAVIELCTRQGSALEVA